MCVYNPAGIFVDGSWMALFPFGLVLSIALMAGMLGFLGHWLLQQNKPIWTSMSQPGEQHFLTRDVRGEQTMADDHAFASGDEQRTPPRRYSRPNDPLKW